MSEIEVSASRKERLFRQYGELVSADELARLLKFPTADALRKAHERGQLPIRMIRMPGRRGFFASTLAVARFIDDCEAAQHTTTSAMTY
jgi:hypothetical protein